MRAAVIGALAMALVGGGAAAGPPATTADGVYSKEQAEAGETLYGQHCLVCHDRKYFRPVLKRWQGQSLDVLFDVMVGSMPESNPGGLTDDEYLDILAYILSESRNPAAAERLTRARLPAITIGGS